MNANNADNQRRIKDAKHCKRKAYCILEFSHFMMMRRASAVQKSLKEKKIFEFYIIIFSNVRQSLRELNQVHAVFGFYHQCSYTLHTFFLYSYFLCRFILVIFSPFFFKTICRWYTQDDNHCLLCRFFWRFTPIEMKIFHSF